MTKTLDAQSLTPVARFSPDAPGTGWTSLDGEIAFLQELDPRKSRLVFSSLGGEVRKSVAASGSRGPVVCGDYVVAGGGANSATPGVYRVETAKKVGGLKGHKGMVGGLACLGGATIATGGLSTKNKGDCTIRLWDLDTQKESHRIKVSGITRKLTAATHGFAATWLHEPGKRLVSFDASGEVRWDVAAKSTNLAVSADGSRLFQPGTVRSALIDPDDGSMLAEGDGPGADFVGGVHQVSDDGSWGFMSLSTKQYQFVGTAIWDLSGSPRFVRVVEGLDRAASGPGEGQIAGWVNGAFSVFDEAALVA